MVVKSGKGIARQPTTVGRSTLVHGDCFEWMQGRKPESIHAIVTESPYGVQEYSEVEKAKGIAGLCAVWRVPPQFGDCKRMPLPRFARLTFHEHWSIRQYYAAWAKLVMRVLIPDGHIFLATHPLVSHLVYQTIRQLR